MTDRRYSVMRGGLVYALFEWLGLARGRRAVAIGVALAAVLLAFAPLLLACVLDGTLVGDRVDMPLLRDYEVLGRFLLVVPLLVLVAPRADAIARRDLRQLVGLGLVRRGQHARLHHALAWMRRARDSRLPELACLALALVPSLLLGRSTDALGDTTTWRLGPGGEASLALHWFQHVSVPVFRFVALLWLWRFLLWSLLLWRLARLDLALRPAHPDGAGGLRFLGDTQQRCFAVLALAGGILIGSEVVNAMVYLDAPLLGFKFLLGGYVLGATLFLIAPLLLLVPTMARARRRALRAYDMLAKRTAATFDKRWRTLCDDEEAPVLLDDDDASGMADFGAAYQTARGMVSVPLSKANVLRIAGMAVLPLLPLVFLEVPLVELLKRIVSALA